MKRSFTFGLMVATLGVLITAVGAPASAAEVFGIKGGNGCFGCDGATANARLEVRASDGSAKILVTETGGGAVPMFELNKSGIAQFRINNTVQGAPWDFKSTPGGFVINRVTAGGAQFQMTEGGEFRVGVLGASMKVTLAGDMTIGGTLTELSDVTAKENFGAVNSIEVLDKVASLPISTWNYIDNPDSTRHMGPMAQDFHAAFGLGATETGISVIDRDGVAFAAIQGLNQKLEAKSQEVDELRRQMDELRSLLESVVTAQ